MDPSWGMNCSSRRNFSPPNFVALAHSQKQKRHGDCFADRNHVGFLRFPGGFSFQRRKEAPDRFWIANVQHCTLAHLVCKESLERIPTRLVHKMQYHLYIKYTCATCMFLYLWSHISRKKHPDTYWEDTIFTANKKIHHQKYLEDQIWDVQRCCGRSIQLLIQYGYSKLLNSPDCAKQFTHQQ